MTSESSASAKSEKEVAAVAPDNWADLCDESDDEKGATINKRLNTVKRKRAQEEAAAHNSNGGGNRGRQREPRGRQHGGHRGGRNDMGRHEAGRHDSGRRDGGRNEGGQGKYANFYSNSNAPRRYAQSEERHSGGQFASGAGTFHAKHADGARGPKSGAPVSGLSKTALSDISSKLAATLRSRDAQESETVESKRTASAAEFKVPKHAAVHSDLLESQAKSAKKLAPAELPQVEAAARATNRSMYTQSYVTGFPQTHPSLKSNLTMSTRADAFMAQGQHYAPAEQCYASMPAEREPLAAGVPYAHDYSRVVSGMNVYSPAMSMYEVPQYYPHPGYNGYYCASYDTPVYPHGAAPLHVAPSVASGVASGYAPRVDYSEAPAAQPVQFVYKKQPRPMQEWRRLSAKPQYNGTGKCEHREAFVAPQNGTYRDDKQMTYAEVVHRI